MGVFGECLDLESIEHSGRKPLTFAQKAIVLHVGVQVGTNELWGFHVTKVSTGMISRNLHTRKCGFA